MVGVVLNLAVWFGHQVLFPPGGSFNWMAAGIGVAAFVAMQVFKIDILLVILGAALAGFGGFLLGI